MPIHTGPLRQCVRVGCGRLAFPGSDRCAHHPPHATMTPIDHRDSKQVTEHEHGQSASTAITSASASTSVEPAEQAPATSTTRSTSKPATGWAKPSKQRRRGR